MGRYPRIVFYFSHLKIHVGLQAYSQRISVSEQRYWI